MMMVAIIKARTFFRVLLRCLNDDLALRAPFCLMR